MKLVAAAIIENEGRYLLAQRQAGGPLGLKWEFPGGKVEPGETPEAALARELNEEFGVTATIGAHVATSDYDYGDGVLRIMAYEVVEVRGIWETRVHAEVRWVTAVEAEELDLLPADVPILAVLDKSVK